MNKIFGSRRNPTNSHEDPYAHCPDLNIDSQNDLPEFIVDLTTTSEVRQIRERDPGYLFVPAILIALGKTGEIVLQQWIQTLKESNASTDSIYAIYLYNQPAQGTNFPSDHIDIWSLNLHPEAGQIYGEKIGDSRSYQQACFNQAAKYEIFTDRLTHCLDILKKNVLVFIIGSVQEIEIGMIGNVLQLLGLLRGSDNDYFRSINAILSLSAPDEVKLLESAEVYAALREISRMTFLGPHIMPPAIGECYGTVEKNLIDHLFLIDSIFPGQRELQNISFEDGIGKIISETLFTLTHPSSGNIWEHLSNELSAGDKSVRPTVRFPLVNGISTVSLYLPVDSLKSYSAARLAKAVLLGERGSADEGLFIKEKTHQIQELGKDWIQAEPYQHPFFDWVLKAFQGSRIKHIPPVPAQASLALRKKLGVNITRFLNEKNYPDDESGSIISASETVEWLFQQFEKLKDQISGQSQMEDSENIVDFQHFLSESILALSSLKNDIHLWIEAAFPGTTIKSNQILESISDQKTSWNPFKLNERPPKQADESDINPFKKNVQDNNPFEPMRPTEAVLIENPSPVSIPELLESRIRKAELNLQKASQGKFKISVLRGAQNSDEIAKFYKDVVRPELIGNHAESPFFDRIRQYTGWWVSSSIDKPRLQLRAVCLVPGWTQSTLASDFSWEAGQALDYAENIYKLSKSFLHELKHRIDPQWFSEQAELKVDILQRAQLTALDYDRDTAVDFKNEFIAIQRGYLISRTLDEASRKVDIPFGTYLSPELKNPVGGGDDFRLTAFTITTNIPIQVVRGFQDLYRNYRVSKVKHLYPQELHAKEYEKLIRDFDWKNQEAIFSTRTVMALADPTMLQIFFQALFSGLIQRKEAQDRLKPANGWKVLKFETFPEVDLQADATIEQLWQAFQNFALVLPYGKRGDDTHPLSEKKKGEYLRGLQDQIRIKSQENNYAETRKSIKNELLSRLEQLGQSDAHSKDMAHLIMIAYNNLWNQAGY